MASSPRTADPPNDPAGVTNKSLVKVSMNFTPQTIDVLRGLARSQGTTMTEVVRRSIGLQKFIAEEMEAGGKLIIEDVKGNLKRVLLP